MLISIAALIGTYITYLIVEDVLTREALQEEAAHFWQKYEADPDHPLPDVANMKAFLAEQGNHQDLPPALQELQAGFGRATGLPDQPLVFVSDRGADRLYLVFASAQVSELVFYFGLAPLAAVLLTVYILLFITYRLSNQAISPMLNLARALEEFDFRSSDRLVIPVQPADVDNETRLMVEAFGEFSERLDQFIERERTFTRNAGHELRTPIAVIKGSLELLSTNASLSEQDQTTVQRMQKVLAEVESVLETLLMLAREEDVRADEPTSLSHVIAEELELLAELAEEQGSQVVVHENSEATCNAKGSVAAIITSNLLRNALTFTNNGTVEVTIDADRLVIADNGIGMSKLDAENAFTAFYRGDSAKSARPGQGLGLALVRRLTQQLGWRVTIDSELARGTTVTVYFK